MRSFYLYTIFEKYKGKTKNYGNHLTTRSKQNNFFVASNNANIKYKYKIKTM